MPEKYSYQMSKYLKNVSVHSFRPIVLLDLYFLQSVVSYCNCHMWSCSALLLPSHVSASILDVMNLQESQRCNIIYVLTMDFNIIVLQTGFGYSFFSGIEHFNAKCMTLFDYAVDVILFKNPEIIIN